MYERRLFENPCFDAIDIDFTWLSVCKTIDQTSLQVI